ncbi:MAG: glycosyl transferase, family 2 [Acidobacteria bacterium]|nr:glycosyl transferase, family 2 [Acidobacteriota bacterium]
MGRALNAREPLLVSVVLITWNSATYLRRCLAGLRGQTYRPLEVIVVDNGSIDDSVAIIAAGLPEARVIRNEGNRGFAAAANQGIDAAGGELVLFCNPDAFFSPGYAEQLVAALQTAGAEFGAATGLLLRGEGSEIAPTGTVDSKGIRMTRSGRHLDIDQGEPADAPDGRGLRPLASPGHRSLFEVFGVSGAAALYRHSFLRDVAIDDQPFDEDFFAYREDADLAWRGRLFGWRALYVPAAVAYHVRTVTPERRRLLSPVINMHSVKNRWLLRWKNEGLYLAVRNAPFELLRDLVAVAAVLLIERSSLPAFRWLWKNRRRTKEKRRRIQQLRRVPDRTLAEWFR